MARALLRRHWPHSAEHMIKTYDLHPATFLRMRALDYAALPAVQRVRELARLEERFGGGGSAGSGGSTDNSGSDAAAALELVLLHSARGVVADGSIPLADQRAHEAFQGGVLPLRFRLPYPMPAEELYDCSLVIRLQGRVLWRVSLYVLGLEVAPSQPFFRSTPGEQR